MYEDHTGALKRGSPRITGDESVRASGQRIISSDEEEYRLEDILVIIDDPVGDPMPDRSPSAVRSWGTPENGRVATV